VVCAFGLLFFVAAEIGLALSFRGEGNTPFATFWPASGLFLGTLAIMPRRRWPAFIASAVVANLVFNMRHGHGFGNNVAFLLANCLEPVVGATILQRWQAIPFRLADMRAILQLVIGGILVGPLLGAAVGAAGLLLSGTTSEFWSSCASWWTADAIGVVVVAPVIIVGREWSSWQIRWTWFRIAEAVVLTAGILALAYSVFGGESFFHSLIWRRPFLLLPFMLWAGTRFQRLGAALAGATVSFLAVLGTAHEVGVFSELTDAVYVQAVMVQIYTTLMCLTPLCFAIVIAEREQSLYDSQERQRQTQLIIDTANDAFVAMDSSGVIVSWNPQAEMLFGWSAQEAAGRRLTDLIIPREYHAAHENALANFLATGIAKVMNRRVEMIALHRDGRRIPVELTVAPLASRGTYVFHAFVHNITERKQAEQKFRQLMESAPDGIVIMDVAGQIVLVNRQTEILFGYPRNEMIGQDVELLIPERLRKMHRALRQAFVNDPHARPMGEGRDLRGLRRDGTEFPTEISLNPIRFESRLLISASIRDVTQRRAVEAELAEKNRLLLQSERLAAIGETMAGLAHESRNVLQRSQACLEMLRPRLDPNSREYELVQRIQQAQDRLQHLHEELRQFAGPIRLSVAVCDLRKILATAWESLATVHAGRQITFQQAGTVFDSCCEGDAIALEQVFRNILENSLTICPDPLVLHVHWEEATLRGESAINIYLRDNGPGIPGEIRDKLFTPFVTTKTQGTGLGLAITKRLIQAHGGAIRVGEAAEGAEIVVTLLRKTPGAST